jgi:hypothetical protein
MTVHISNIAVSSWYQMSIGNFIFQACRGKQLDAGIMVKQRGRSQSDSSPSSLKIPTHADFLIAYSTVQGNKYCS